MTQTIFPRPWGNDESLTMGDGNCPMCGCDLKSGETIYLNGICRVCFGFRVDNKNPDPLADEGSVRCPTEPEPQPLADESASAGSLRFFPRTRRRASAR